MALTVSEEAGLIGMAGRADFDEADLMCSGGAAARKLLLRIRRQTKFGLNALGENRINPKSPRAAREITRHELPQYPGQCARSLRWWSFRAISSRTSRLCARTGPNLSCWPSDLIPIFVGLKVEPSAVGAEIREQASVACEGGLSPKSGVSRLLLRGTGGCRIEHQSQGNP